MSLYTIYTYMCVYAKKRRDCINECVRIKYTKILYSCAYAYVIIKYIHICSYIAIYIYTIQCVTVWILG